MRSQSSNIRKRLQVNAPTFDEEKCGTRETGSFYHRLVTEWDSSYINEIRHRATVQKFCVKTDIIRIRETVRKKFFLFFMQVINCCVIAVHTFCGVICIISDQ